MQTLDQTFRRSCHVLIPLACAVVVFAATIAAFPPPPLVGDAYAYSAAAYRLVNHGFFAYGPGPYETTAAPNARVTPGHVLVLAAAYRLSGHADAPFDVASVRARPLWHGAQLAFALATVAFLALAGEELGGRRLGLLTGLAAALYAPLAWATTVALAESVGCMLVAAQLWLALRLCSTRSTATIPEAAAFGAVSALVLLTRPAVVAWTALPLTYLVVRRTVPIRRAVLLVTAAAIAFCLVCSPWWIRNAVVLRQWVPIRTDLVKVDGRLVNVGHEAPPQIDPGAKPLVVAWTLTTPWSAPYDVLLHRYADRVPGGVDFAPFPPTLARRLVAQRTAWMVYQTLFVVSAALAGLTLWRRSPRLLLAAAMPVLVIAVHWSTMITDRYFFLAMPHVLLAGAAGLLTALARARSSRARVQ